MDLSLIDEPVKRRPNCILRSAFFSFVGLTALLASSCEESSTANFDGSKFFSPLAITIIPGENLALVMSTNFDFANSLGDPLQPGGAINVVDLNTFTIDSASTLQFNNLGGEISVDTANHRIFAADRDTDQVQIFNYVTPGSNGKLIDISKESTLDIGEDPFSTALVSPGGSVFRKLYVANVQTDDLTLVNADALNLVDMNPDDPEREALRLDIFGVGSTTLQSTLIRPNRLLPFGNEGLILLTTRSAGLIFAIDSKNDRIEAAYDLRGLSVAPELSGIAITPNNLAFVASRGVNGILVLDFTELRENGIDNEILQPALVRLVPTGGFIDGIIANATGSKVYATDRDRNLVLVIDGTTGFVTKEIAVGDGPSEMAITDNGTQLLVTNFIGNSISVINTASETLERTIE